MTRFDKLLLTIAGAYTGSAASTWVTGMFEKGAITIVVTLIMIYLYAKVRRIGKAVPEAITIANRMVGTVVLGAILTLLIFGLAVLASVPQPLVTWVSVFGGGMFTLFKLMSLGRRLEACPLPSPPSDWQS